MIYPPRSFQTGTGKTERGWDMSSGMEALIHPWVKVKPVCLRRRRVQCSWDAVIGWVWLLSKNSARPCIDRFRRCQVSVFDSQRNEAGGALDNR